jgi:hypothetical protein
MPGKKISDHQMLQYKKQRQTRTQSAAAAMVGVSERSAQRIEAGQGLLSQQPPRHWRTRPDPFEAVWDGELVPLLEINPHLSATTLFEELERRRPGEYAAGQVRTIQRRVRDWRAQHGPGRAVFFAQEHPPGRQGLSDFTVADDIGVTIDGTVFRHRLYQFALAHSGWRHAEIVEGGETFEALSSGLQSALWNLGGSPEEHRTDSLSAAFRNLNADEKDDLTKRYESLCAHDTMRATRCNPGESHENGSIEARNGSLKRALRQALLLRGNADFVDRAAYSEFVRMIVNRMNARVENRAGVERASLRLLPQRRTAEFTEFSARVSKYGLFTIKGALYSAPNRLVGHRLVVRQYVDRVECWLGGNRVHECPRATRRDGRHARQIDYRHLIGGLKKKPGAFARWTMRDEVFPRAVYRVTWDALVQRCPEREACKTMVGLLVLAAEGHEAELAIELEALRAANELPDLEVIRNRFCPHNAAFPALLVPLPALSVYDGLLEAAAL